jgi:hypothetical protein
MPREVLFDRLIKRPRKLDRMLRGDHELADELSARRVRAHVGKLKDHGDTMTCDALQNEGFASLGSVIVTGLVGSVIRD